MKKFLMCCSVMAILMSAASALAAAKFEINYQSMYPPTHIFHEPFYKPAMERIKERTNGSLTIHLFPSGAIVKPDDLVPAIKNGNLDMGTAMLSFQSTLFPHAQAFHVPHLTTDSWQASDLFWKMYSEIPEIKAELDAIGKVITVWGADRFAFASRDKAIRTPADLKGKRVLLWTGNMVDMVKAWGGVPVQVGVNDIYMALQRGMGDVFLGPLPAIYPNKLYEVAKNITIMPSTPMVLVTFMNQKLWNSLGTENQTILMEEFGGEKASNISGELLYTGALKEIAAMEKLNCTFFSLTAEEYAMFKQADHDILQAYWNKELTRLGIQDPQMWMDKAYNMAKEIPTAQQRLTSK